MKYTSLKLSKLLAENWCELESEWYWNEKDQQRYQNITWRIIWDEWLPAYDILNDICCKYAKEFFGDRYWKWTTASNILFLIQDWEKKTAEEYIWEHTIFNPKNKWNTVQDAN